ncbi:acetyl-lysine deacetylase [Halobacteriales archaeon SW_7_71_33]|nr:MAG: acetyl-lysine deacetylase [Halobacteriales archaeon SW_7_71_33]
MSRTGDAAVPTAEAHALLESMVSIPSPSGEERAAAEHLVGWLREHGREAWLDEVGNVRAPGEDGVLLSSHVDTVPGDLPVRVADGELHGRGSVDATGPLCAMAVAAVETGVSFAGVVGEETDSRGARHLVSERDAPAAVVNGEPGGWDALTLGYRGFLAGAASARTGSAHTSRPEPNAVQHLLDWWAEVEATYDDGDGPVFETVTAKPVAVEGGLDDDGTAVTAEMEVQFRLPPDVDAATVRTAVADDRVDVDWSSPVPPTLQSARTDLARAFRAAVRSVGGDPRHLRKTGTSDVNLYADSWDCPALTYGPGDSALDHAPDERLDLSGYDRAVDVLVRACKEVAT